MCKTIEQITAEINAFVDKTNQDLQISTPSKPLDVSPFQKAAVALSGFNAAFGTPFYDIIEGAVERQRRVAAISALTGAAEDEVRDFYHTHNHSLKFIEVAARYGAKLDEEDIKQTMEKVKGLYAGGSSTEGLGIPDNSPPRQNTFIVILPDNDRREVQATYMEVDGGCLYFEDDNRETILAYGPGHWVWAERMLSNE